MARSPLCAAPTPAALLLAAALVAACSSTGHADGSNALDASLDRFVGQEASLSDAPDTSTDQAAGDVTAPIAEDAADDDAPTLDAPADDPPCTLARPYSQQNPSCNECAQRECCAEINGCLLDPACDDSFVNCMLACTLDTDASTIPPCIDDCEAQYPTGKAEYDVAVGCADSKCAAACGP